MITSFPRHIGQEIFLSDCHDLSLTCMSFLHVKHVIETVRIVYGG